MSPLISSRLRVELARARRSAIILAVGIVAGIVAIAIVIAKENVHLPWQGRYTAQVAVDNATGVVAGLDEVRWAGIVVGRVTGVRFVNDQPVLTAQMNTADVGGARLYRDARVELRPATPLSDMYLDVISRGHAAAGTLTANEILPAAQAQTPINVADVLNTFSEPIRQRLGELLGELATGLSPAGGTQLREAYGAIAPLLVAQRRLAETINARGTLVKALIHDSSRLFAALNERDTELATLVQNGSATLGALGHQSAALGRLVAALPGTMGRLRSSFGQLGTTLADVRPALVDLLPTARRLPGGLAALRSFARTAEPALRALDPAITALEPLVRDLPGTATATRRALTELEPQIPELNHITTTLVPCELSTDKFFAWTLSVLKYDNSANLTASPRGQLVVGPFETGKDPTLSPSIGCGDHQPAPTTPTQ